MTSVKQDSGPHILALMGMVFGEVRRTFDAEEWDGMRQSHFRVIDGVSEDGISVTELSRRVGMSKQGCGQFVSHLVGTGHLRVDPDPQDGRVRLVRRTPRGQRTLEAANARIREIEDGWAQAVGTQRYRAFRRVLEDLARLAVG